MSPSGASSSHASRYFSFESVSRMTMWRRPAPVAAAAALAEPPPGAGASDARAAVKSATLSDVSSPMAPPPRGMREAGSYNRGERDEMPLASRAPAPPVSNIRLAAALLDLASAEELGSRARTELV